MQNWFETKVKSVRVGEDGRERKANESYLVDAVSFTDAEARITQLASEFTRGEFSVSGIKPSNIVEIFSHDDGEWWYKAKISLVTIDEHLGKEMKVNQYFLVNANDLKQALLRLEEGLSYMLVPYVVTSIALTAICDVFPYFGNERNENEQPLQEETDGEEE